MAAYPKFRTVHTWAGLIVLLPIVVVAATGFMLNHEESLGLKPKRLAMASDDDHHDEHHEKKPHGNHEKKYQSPGHPVANDFVAKPGTAQQLATAMEQAIAAAAGEWGGELPLERIEFKQEPGYGLVVKVKADKRSEMHEQEVIYSVAEGQPMVEVKKGNWVLDLHTGKIFSRLWGYWWSDAAAVALVALSITGVVLYVIPLVKKRQKKKKSAIAEERSLATKAHATSPARPSAAALARAAALKAKNDKLALGEVASNDHDQLHHVDDDGIADEHSREELPAEVAV
jgi:hypothetical protein